MLKLEKPWARQPQLPWRLSKAAEKTVFALNAAVPKFSLEPRATWFDALGGGVLHRPGLGGIGQYAPAATRAERWTGIETGTDFTIVAVVLDSVGRGANRSFLDADNNSGAGRNWQFRCGASNTLDFFVFNTALSVFSGGTTVATQATEPTVLVGRVRANVVQAWINGVAGTSPQTITGTQQTLTASELLTVNARATSAGSVSQYAQGNLYWAQIIAEALPDFVIETFQRPTDVYQWALAPKRIWVPMPAIAGGLPTLTASTYKPGTLTTSGWTARITAS